MLLHNHENWFQCDGTCTNPPRNRKFSHGFGSRYEFPLPKVKNAPVPSKADYSQKNVAWLIEMFANMLGVEHTEITLRYENNTPDDKTDDIEVTHPNDKLYLPTQNACQYRKSEALKQYERAAKKSKLLKLYEENSPAQINYFKPIC